MAKPLDAPNPAPSLSENLSELKEVLPDIGEYLEMLLTDIEVYDGPGTRTKLEATLDFLNTQLGTEILSSLDGEIKNAFKKLEENDPEGNLKIVQGKRILSEIQKSLAKERPVSAAYLAPLLSGYKEVKKQLGKPYKVVNVIMSATDVGRLLNACGLDEDTKGGDGAHTKWFDPSGEMKGTYSTSPNGKIWLGVKVKELLELGLPFERMQDACEACGYSLKLKNVDNDEE